MCRTTRDTDTPRATPPPFNSLSVLTLAFAPGFRASALWWAGGLACGSNSWSDKEKIEEIRRFHLLISPWKSEIANLLMHFSAKNNCSRPWNSTTWYVAWVPQRELYKCLAGAECVGSSSWRGEVEFVDLMLFQGTVDLEARARIGRIGLQGFVYLG